ncbi:MAG: SGNH/GDSL hydrolase family protein [Acidimicrobiia bacterium]|nr:SGNH/GDSL hydrolase family protein [Acidimicrobiia bacterium]
MLIRSTALLLVAACASGGGGTTPSVPPGLRYLALGDSYTIGESVAAAERWPVVLGSMLEAEGLSPVEVEIVARTGWTTAELDLGIDRADPQGPFDLVTLLIGVNNQYRGLSLRSYESEFAALVDRAIGFAGGEPSRVIVVSIPDWGVTPFAGAGGSDQVRIAAEIDAFNAAAEAIARDAGVAFVDITEISRSGAVGLVADDGLHPSAQQYRLWVEAIIPLALEALGG